MTQAAQAYSDRDSDLEQAHWLEVVLGYSPKDLPLEIFRMDVQADMRRFYLRVMGKPLKITPPGNDAGSPTPSFRQPTAQQPDPVSVLAGPGAAGFSPPDYHQETPATQLVLPGTSGPVAVPEPATKQSRRPTGYQYGQGEFFEAALSVIERRAATPASPDDPGPRKIDLALLPGSQLLLSLILAWMNFKLFRGMGGRSGQWMTLCFDRIARELRGEYQARSEVFLRCLSELVRVGIVHVDRLDGRGGIITEEELTYFRAQLPMLPSELGPELGAWWSSRSLQKTSYFHKGKKAGMEKTGTNFYRLKPGITLERELPLFIPLENQERGGKYVKSTQISGTQGQGNTLETGGKQERHIPYDGKYVGNTWDMSPGDVGSTMVVPTYSHGSAGVSPTFAQGVHDMNEYEHEYEAPLAPGGNYLDEAVVETLEPDGRQAFQLMLELGNRMEGYNGLPFDRKVALDQVTKDRYSLLEVEEATRRFLLDWAKPSLRQQMRNPFGVFIGSTLPKIREELSRPKSKPKPSYRPKVNPKLSGTIDFNSPKYQPGGVYNPIHPAESFG